MSKIAVSSPAAGTATYTISAPSGNTDRTLTLPDATGTLLTTATPGVPVNGPAFSAGANASTTLTTSASVKLLFAVEEFDTNNNFASSRFTPTVAGYYQINACCDWTAIGSSSNWIAIWKNGSEYQRGNRQLASSALAVTISSLVYFNGSTDYVEIYAFTNGSSTTTAATSSTVWFNGALVRSAT